VIWQDLNHQPYPYPLKFHPSIEAYQNYFRFPAPLNQQDSEQHPLSDVSFHHLVTE